METLRVERADGVVTVTMDRPDRKNAINDTMWIELWETFQAVARSTEDRVLIVTGAGGAFCSGQDLSGVSEGGDHGDVALALHRVPKPTIAKVGGIAAGAGCNLALGCDLIVASDDARFSEIFSRRGLSVDFGGSWVLPRLIGLHRAKELAFFAEIVSAKEAADIGLVNRVVPAADLDGFVDDWARTLAAGPPLALSMTKTMLNNGMATSMEQAVEDEARCQAMNFSTADTVEAVQAFSQKRDPKFRGV
jgi:2-(1,2-epoxy-1,2-dihydrophenyl)acetyl-CoA isomerase